MQSVIDQAALLGTNYLDLPSYYQNSLLSVLSLDEFRVQNEVNNYIKENYNSSNIKVLKINVLNNEIYIDIVLNHYLPFEIPYRFISINATTSAKLMLD